MPTIPEIEPAEIRVGFTTSWYKDVTDYPPSGGWTLKYALRNSAQKITLTAATSGTRYLTTVTASGSSAYVVGIYTWVAYVTKGTAETLDQHEVDRGTIALVQNYSADAVYDGRSDARIIYDNLITKYKAFISSGGEMQSMSVAGKSVSFRSAEDFLTQIKYWEAKVRDEEDAEAVANGGSSSRQVGVRLSRI